jgi:hypothetical protein
MNSAFGEVDREMHPLRQSINHPDSHCRFASFFAFAVIIWSCITAWVSSRDRTERILQSLTCNRASLAEYPQFGWAAAGGFAATALECTATSI